MVKRQWSHGSAETWLRSPGSMTWRRAYPGRADQVAVARRFAGILFAGTGHECEVEFIVSELVSNALLHTNSGQAGGWFGVEVALDELAYVAVTDLGGGGVPTVRNGCPTELAKHGRGLLGVSNLAAALGIHGSPTCGHTVWVDLDLRSAKGPNTAAEATTLAS